MKAEVILKCSKCGKDFTMDHAVTTLEEKKSWEKWAKETYKSPYCPICRNMPGFSINSIRADSVIMPVRKDKQHE